VSEEPRIRPQKLHCRCFVYLDALLKKTEITAEIAYMSSIFVLPICFKWKKNVYMYTWNPLCDVVVTIFAITLSVVTCVIMFPSSAWPAHQESKQGDRGHRHNQHSLHCCWGLQWSGENCQKEEKCEGRVTEYMIYRFLYHLWDSYLPLH